MCIRDRYMGTEYLSMESKNLQNYLEYVLKRADLVKRVASILDEEQIIEIEDLELVSEDDLAGMGIKKRYAKKLLKKRARFLKLDMLPSKNQIHFVTDNVRATDLEKGIENHQVIFKVIAPRLLGNNSGGIRQTKEKDDEYNFHNENERIYQTTAVKTIHKAVSYTHLTLPTIYSV
eukprot:TRINITY_DN10122_c0_g1_i1.p1 TRINITY_DN10122_c0_g1~~TRINITY_DN10122_c0_g1_i1.p1  ORF type:complete len:176 (+),score=25.15 TRINITY_DN10122_c0_g1_i1:65-592(+)